MKDESKNHGQDGENDKDTGAPAEGSFFNKMRSDAFKRKVEAKLKEGVFKNIVSELKMPREIVTHLISQIDDTKQAALGVISREVRLFFENTNLADELARLLSQLSFEVSTQVRFIPNEKRIGHEEKCQERDRPASSREPEPDADEPDEPKAGS
jgi:hypothetical protein